MSKYSKSMSNQKQTEGISNTLTYNGNGSNASNVFQNNPTFFQFLNKSISDRLVPHKIKQKLSCQIIPQTYQCNQVFQKSRQDSLGTIKNISFLNGELSINQEISKNYNIQTPPNNKQVQKELIELQNMTFSKQQNQSDSQDKNSNQKYMQKLQQMCEKDNVNNNNSNGQIGSFNNYFQSKSKNNSSGKIQTYIDFEQEQFSYEKQQQQKIQQLQNLNNNNSNQIKEENSDLQLDSEKNSDQNQILMKSIDTIYNSDYKDNKEFSSKKNDNNDNYSSYDIRTLSLLKLQQQQQQFLQEDLQKQIQQQLLLENNSNINNEQLNNNQINTNELVDQMYQTNTKNKKKFDSSYYKSDEVMFTDEILNTNNTINSDTHNNILHTDRKKDTLQTSQENNYFSHYFQTLEKEQQLANKSGKQCENNVQISDFDDKLNIQYENIQQQQSSNRQKNEYENFKNKQQQQQQLINKQQQLMMQQQCKKKLNFESKQINDSNEVNNGIFSNLQINNSMKNLNQYQQQDSNDLNNIKFKQQQLSQKNDGSQKQQYVKFFSKRNKSYDQHKFSNNKTIYQSILEKENYNTLGNTNNKKTKGNFQTFTNILDEKKRINEINQKKNTTNNTTNTKKLNENIFGICNTEGCEEDEEFLQQKQIYEELQIQKQNQINLQKQLKMEGKIESLEDQLKVLFKRFSDLESVNFDYQLKLQLSQREKSDLKIQNTQYKMQIEELKNKNQNQEKLIQQLQLKLLAFNKNSQDQYYSKQQKQLNNRQRCNNNYYVQNSVKQQDDINMENQGLVTQCSTATIDSPETIRSNSSKPCFASNQGQFETQRKFLQNTKSKQNNKSDKKFLDQQESAKYIQILKNKSLNNQLVNQKSGITFQGYLSQMGSK